MSNTCLILGAKSDIAEAIAYEFAMHGFNIQLAARKTDALLPLQNDIKIKHKVNVEVFVFDGLGYANHNTFFESLPIKPNVVISVYGYLGEQKKAEENFSESHLIIQTNFSSQVSILNIFANYFEEKKEGTIIGISSVAGDRGRQSNYIYGASKAAFTEYLSGLRNRLFKSNVHVMTVKPGFVNTQMTKNLPLPKPLTAQPKQVAIDVYKGFIKKKNIIYTLFFWRYIMLIIKMIPESIFKKLKL